MRRRTYIYSAMTATLSWMYTSSNGAGHGSSDLERNGDAKIQGSEPPTPHSVMKMAPRDRGTMEDTYGTLSSVALCIEQLCRSSLTTQEKESSLKQLLDLIETRDKAFGAVGSHSQAVPILVSLLRSGSLGIKLLAASALGSLCKEEELQVKVLLSGCMPPLLALLKSSSSEGQVAGAKTIYSVSRGGARDRVGSKIFSTEGVVPVLWEQLKSGLKNENVVNSLRTAALKNLSNSTEGFWSATVGSGATEVLLKLLANAQTSTLANVCYLLACMMMEEATVCSEVLSGGTTKQILNLLGPAAIEKDLWANGSVSEEYLKSLNSLHSNFPSLRDTEPATLSIPHLATSLKTGSEATKEAALDSLFLLRQAWSACPAEVSKAQSVAASEAIPLLQYLIQSDPPHFQEKAEFLLQCLPGTHTVVIKCGNNLRQSVGEP